jgi:hypothetical protein
MNPKIQEYIDHTLRNIAIVEEIEAVGFEGIKIYDFRTHHENGKDFTHQNGENYGLAYLNAITEESAKKISRELKKNKNLTVKSLKEFVERQRLKCYVKGGSKSFLTWEKGDVGVLYLEFNDEKKTMVPRFVNESARGRS